MALHIPPKKGNFSLKRLKVTIKADEFLGEYRFPNTFDLINIGSSAPGRFRLYRDADSRIKDERRTPEQDPEPAGGVILDVVFIQERLRLDLSPLPWGSAVSLNKPCFWRFEGVKGTEITLELLQLEP